MRDRCTGRVFSAAATQQEPQAETEPTISAGVRASRGSLGRCLAELLPFASTRACAMRGVFDDNVAGGREQNTALAAGLDQRLEVDAELRDSELGPAVGVGAKRPGPAGRIRLRGGACTGRQADVSGDQYSRRSDSPVALKRVAKPDTSGRTESPRRRRGVAVELGFRCVTNVPSAPSS